MLTWKFDATAWRRTLMAVLYRRRAHEKIA